MSSTDIVQDAVAARLALGVHRANPASALGSDARQSAVSDVIRPFGTT